MFLRLGTADVMQRNASSSWGAGCGALNIILLVVNPIILLVGSTAPRRCFIMDGWHSTWYGAHGQPNLPLYASHWLAWGIEVGPRTCGSNPTLYSGFESIVLPDQAL